MQLTINKREITKKKVKTLRKEGLVPGVVYGRHLDKPYSIMFNKIEFIKIYRQTGESTPLDLKGDKMDNLVLIQEIQTHPVTGEVLHVDFLAVRSDEKVEAQVSIILEGASVVEKDGLGRIQLLRDHLTVEAFPQDLPHHIVIDISKILTPNDVIFVKDIDLGKKVEIKEDLDQPVVTVAEIKEEVEASPTAEATPASGTAGAAATPAAGAKDEKKEEKKK